MKTFNEIYLIPEFKKDLKKLGKRFKTLEEDLNIFIKSQLKMYHKLGIDNRGIFKIGDLNIKYPKIYKARKFACRSLKGKGVYSGNLSFILNLTHFSAFHLQDLPILDLMVIIILISIK